MVVATPHRAPAASDTAEATAGRIGTRRGLPGGRAIAGGLLVAIAALGTFAAATGGDGPAGSVVVAARGIAPGTVLAAEDVDLATGEVPGSAAGATFARVEDVVGAVAVGPLGEGELVQAGALADVTEGAVPTLSVALDPADADGGAVGRGDRVQVLATYGSDASATTVALSAAAQVVSVADGGDDLSTAGQVLVRLAVASAHERAAIVHAAAAGHVALVRTTGAAEPGVGRYQPDLSDGEDG